MVKETTFSLTQVALDAKATSLRHLSRPEAECLVEDKDLPRIEEDVSLVRYMTSFPLLLECPNCQETSS